LLAIFTGVQELIAQYAPDVVALEESYVGADARIALSVGQAREPSSSARRPLGVACAEYSPSTIKQSVCGYGRADKEQVGKMVKAILGLDAVPKPNHAADALAVAICHALAPPLLTMAAS
jgi:crossover junction endodeoxyribonuclease RuvC